MGAGKVARLVFVGHIACKDHILPASLLDKALKAMSQTAFADKDKACLWEPLTNQRDGSQ